MTQSKPYPSANNAVTLQLEEGYITIDVIFADHIPNMQEKAFCITNALLNLIDHREKFYKDLPLDQVPLGVWFDAINGVLVPTNLSRAT